MISTCSIYSNPGFTLATSLQHCRLHLERLSFMTCQKVLRVFMAPLRGSIIFITAASSIILYLSSAILQKDSYVFKDIGCLFPSAVFPLNLLYPPIHPTSAYCTRLFQTISQTMAQNTENSCVFCGINRNQGPNEILFQTEKYLVFKDINPSAEFHFLVIPKTHIDTINNLTSSHAEMVREMYEVGLQVLKGASSSKQGHVLGFHVPPFTSIPHLHLHVIGKPFNSFWRSCKYPENFKVPWFIHAHDLIAKLEKSRISK